MENNNEFEGITPSRTSTAIISKVIAVVFIVYAVFWTENASMVFKTVNNFILKYFNGLYIYTVALVLLFVVALAISPYGKIRLGKDDERPEFKYWSWIAMLFGAGLGIGLLFWSIAEPIWHFTGNPFMPDTAAQTAAGVSTAMQVTIFHWGFHPWALYVLVGGALAFFSYRRGLPLTLSSTLHPILGDKISGPIGKTIDIIAIFGTVFGVATSLGLGVQQLAKGLYILTGNDFFSTKASWYLLILIISSAAVYSAITGVKKGVKILSEWNLYLAVFIMLLVFSFGPTINILTSLFDNIVGYVVNVIPMSFSQKDTGWQSGWTTFYWGWWMSWSPFVGVFIAHISKGRTLREFTIGVLGVSTLISIVWLTIFGNTALFLELQQGGILDAVKQDLTSATYATFDALGTVSIIHKLLLILATVLILTFFITSSDSATLVITTIANNGNINTTSADRIVWGSFEGIVAACLLAVGGLSALQTASIIVALPFSILLWLMAFCLLKGLHEEYKKTS